MNLQAWQSFFTLTGGAAATLLGLVFVAASIAASVPNDKLGDDTSRALWVQPIVWAFLRVLVVSAVGVIPNQTPRSFGVVLCVLAMSDLSRMVWVMRGMRKVHLSREALSMRDWFWYVLYPALATSLIAGTGVGLVMQWSFPVGILAGGMLAHLVIGVRNAYELADWLATRQ